MFFVEQRKIGTTLGSQKEYSAAVKRGIGFASHGNVWHYFWPVDLLESSIRARFEPAVAAEQQARASDEDYVGQGDATAPQYTHYIWSQEVAPGETIGEPVITPYTGNGDWIEEAKTKFIEARRQRTH